MEECWDSSLHARHCGSAPSLSFWLKIICLATAESLHFLGVGLQQRLHDGSDHAQTLLLQQLRQDLLGDLAADLTGPDQLDHLAKRHAAVAMVWEGDGVIPQARGSSSASPSLSRQSPALFGAIWW